MKPESSTNFKTGLCIVLVLGAISAIAFLARKDAPPAEAEISEQSKNATLCANVTPAAASDVMRFVYKIDEGYMVYVEPGWYALRIDDKKSVAAYVARSKLSGSARFLDSRTGKLLARWGANGYVNYQE